MWGACKRLFPLVSLMALLVWFVSPFLRSSVVLELPSSSHSPRLPVPEPGQALNVLLSLPSKSHPRPDKDTLMLCNPILGLAIPWQSNADERLAKQKKSTIIPKKKNSQSFETRKNPFLDAMELQANLTPWWLTRAYVVVSKSEKKARSIREKTTQANPHKNSAKMAAID